MGAWGFGVWGLSMALRVVRGQFGWTICDFYICLLETGVPVYVTTVPPQAVTWAPLGMAYSHSRGGNPAGLVSWYLSMQFPQLCISELVVLGGT